MDIAIRVERRGHRPIRIEHAGLVVDETGGYVRNTHHTLSLSIHRTLKSLYCNRCSKTSSKTREQVTRFPTLRTRLTKCRKALSEGICLFSTQVRLNTKKEVAKAVVLREPIWASTRGTDLTKVARGSGPRTRARSELARRIMFPERGLGLVSCP